jgi:predicted 2-oxoglutarate/Fe(II)-dependent dioxygenase YbiX
MIHILKGVLTAEESAALCAQAFNTNFVEAACEKLSRALWSDPVFQLRSRPAALFAPTLLRNGEALGGEATEVRRADLGVFIFLSPPTDYDGGELILDVGWGAQSFKESAGSCVIAPAEARVEFRTVACGAQWCARFFAQSLLRVAAERDILYDVARAARYLEIFKGGADPAAARLKSCEDALLRFWRES